MHKCARLKPLQFVSPAIVIHFVNRVRVGVNLSTKSISGVWSPMMPTQVSRVGQGQVNYFVFSIAAQRMALRLFVLVWMHIGYRERHYCCQSHSRIELSHLWSRLQDQRGTEYWRNHFDMRSKTCIGDRGKQGLVGL